MDGAGIEAGDRGVLYPFDVKAKDGPLDASSVLRFRGDVVHLVKGSPARHKLLVLDCCHSGEILNHQALPRVVEHLKLADALASDLGAPPFRAFVLCRLAEASQRLDRWADARRYLERAEHVAGSLQDTHPLRAYVHRRQAWTCIEQWRIKEAEEAFDKAEAVYRASASPAAKTDHETLLVRLHTAHGLAMVQRFKGDTPEAFRRYRGIVHELVDAFTLLRLEGADSQNLGDIRVRLVERWVNTHERLADCNLFGDPAKRDVKDAVDDLQRAVRACPNLPAHRRAVDRAQLLFKLAIALAVPSEVQDLELAEAYSKQAARIAKDFNDPQKVELDFYHRLAPPLVLVHAAAPGERRQALAGLRGAIEDLREELRENTNRDHLELLMFSAKVLVDLADPADRHQALEDSELLHGFCRKVAVSRSRVVLRYMRPYYDTVVEARLKLKPRQVEDLLEVQRLATTGDFYIKSDSPVPVLAPYLLDSKACFFLSVPRGLAGGKAVSACFTVTDDETVEKIRRASRSGAKDLAKPLALPKEEQHELQGLLRNLSPSGETAAIRCWGMLPHDSGETQTASLRDGAAVVAPLPFPFVLPRGLVIQPETPPQRLKKLGN